MKQNPNPIPHGHGVYALVHAGSKSLYIGSSTNLRGRYSEWKSTFKHDQPRLIRSNFPLYPVNEWEFRVLERTEGMAEEQIRAREAEFINHAIRRGVPVINKMKPQARQTFIVDGLAGSISFHAARKGKNPTIVNDRMKKGMTLEEALAMPEHDARVQAIESMRCKILNEKNLPMTYAEAAKELGIYPHILRERIIRRNITETTLAELREKA